MAQINFKIFTHKGPDGCFFEASAKLLKMLEYSNPRMLDFCTIFSANIESLGWSITAINIYNVVEGQEHTDFMIDAPPRYYLKDIKEDLFSALEVSAKVGNMEIREAQKQAEK